MLTVAMIGAGNRGKDVYGKYALEHPDEIKFIGVAEPDEVKRNQFVGLHNINKNMIFASWEEMLKLDKFCDTVFICTQDKMHYEPAMQAIQKGYDIMLEKPMSTQLQECIEIVNMSKMKGKRITVAHVLRYTPFFIKVKEILDSGKIGEITTIRLNENVGYWHFAHSYVRGNWSNSSLSSPMILAKSSHDMDILVWLTGKKPIRLSSFGSLKYFKKEFAPKGSGERCVDCRVEKDCPYSAMKIYLGESTEWPVSVISNDLSMDGRIKALKEGPYGKCVYRCDNNVVDHQIVNIEFEEDVYASFVLSGFTSRMSRDITVMGTLGELRGDLEDNWIEINMFGSNDKIVTKPPALVGRHSGGDTGLMHQLVNQNAESSIQGMTTGEVSLMSHIMSFAAEEARISGEVIDLEKFMEKIY
jgi:predicted dehydrogenase